MKSYLNTHPSIILNQAIRDICNPLTKLNIDYFAHVRVTAQNEFSMITSNAGFTEFYFKNKYYNADIHLNTKPTPYLILDAHTLKGSTARLQSEAAHFGVKHIFTISEENNEGKNCYHFGNASNNFSINLTYLANLELLKSFIPFFTEQVNHFTELKIAHHLKFKIANNAGGFQTHSTTSEISSEDREEYMKLIQTSPGNSLDTNIILLNKKNNKPVKLTTQQTRCVTLLAAGHTNKQISMKAGLSFGPFNIIWITFANYWIVTQAKN